MTAICSIEDTGRSQVLSPAASSPSRDTEEPLIRSETATEGAVKDERRKAKSKRKHISSMVAKEASCGSKPPKPGSKYERQRHQAWSVSATRPAVRRLPLARNLRRDYLGSLHPAGLQKGSPPTGEDPLRYLGHLGVCAGMAIIPTRLSSGAIISGLPFYTCGHGDWTTSVPKFPGYDDAGLSAMHGSGLSTATNAASGGTLADGPGGTGAPGGGPSKFPSHVPGGQRLRIRRGRNQRGQTL